MRLGPSCRFFYSNSLDLNFIQSALKRFFCPFLASRVDAPLAQALTPVDALRVCTRLRLLTTVASSGSSYIFFHLLRLRDCQSLIRILRNNRLFDTLSHPRTIITALSKHVHLAQALTAIDALRVCTLLRLLTTVASSGSMRCLNQMSTYDSYCFLLS